MSLALTQTTAPTLWRPVVTSASRSLRARPPVSTPCGGGARLTRNAHHPRRFIFLRLFNDHSVKRRNRFIQTDEVYERVPPPPAEREQDILIGNTDLAILPTDRWCRSCSD